MMNEPRSRKDSYRQARNCLVWSGLICMGVTRALPLAFSIIISILGVGLVLSGCWYWAKYKGKSGWWAMWGLLAPIGFIALSNIKDEYTDSGEAETEKTPQEQETDRLTRIYGREE